MCNPWLEIGAKSCPCFSDHTVMVTQDLCLSQVYLGLCQSPHADPVWARPPPVITDALDHGGLVSESCPST